MGGVIHDPLFKSAFCLVVASRRHTRKGYSQAELLKSQYWDMIANTLWYSVRQQYIYTSWGWRWIVLLSLDRVQNGCLIDKHSPPSTLEKPNFSCFFLLFFFFFFSTKTETPSYSLWNPPLLSMDIWRGNRRTDWFCWLTPNSSFSAWSVWKYFQQDIPRLLFGTSVNWLLNSSSCLYSDR